MPLRDMPNATLMNKAMRARKLQWLVACDPWPVTALVLMLHWSLVLFGTSNFDFI